MSDAASYLYFSFSPQLQRDMPSFSCISHSHLSHSLKYRRKSSMICLVMLDSWYINKSLRNFSVYHSLISLGVEGCKEMENEWEMNTHCFNIYKTLSLSLLDQWLWIFVAQSLSLVWLFATHAAHQASLSFKISQSLLKLMTTESVMPSDHLILCCPRLLLPSIFPSIRAFSNESALWLRWPECWSFLVQWIFRIDFL